MIAPDQLSAGRAASKKAVLSVLGILVAAAIFIMSGCSQAAVSIASQAPGVTSALPEPGDFTLGGNAGGTLVGLTLRPGRPGPNQLLIYLLANDGEKASSDLNATVRVDGTQVPMQRCAATCRLGMAELQGGDVVRVLLGGRTAALVDFHIPALPARAGDAWLEQVNERMHRLKSVRIDESMGPANPPVRSTYVLEAPDKMSIEASTGEEVVTVGDIRLARFARSQEWQRSTLVKPLRVPSFMWDGPAAQSVYLIEDGTSQRGETQPLAFFELSGKTPSWFRLEPDAGALVHRLEMWAPHHVMDQRFYGFDEPVAIKPPTAL